VCWWPFPSERVGDGPLGWACLHGSAIFASMTKIVFITGATSGFGEASAYKFAEHGYNLVLNGRREERLRELQTKLEGQYNISCYLLPFDVRDQKAVFDAINSLPAEWKAIDILFNNAGLALGRDLFHEADIEDWNTMIDTNLKGLLYVSKAVVPFMIERKQGHIINMGSIAAKDVYERGNAYCASKAGVDSISQAMRVDLLSYHIKVTAIHPGAAETEFSLVRFKGQEQTARKMYEGFTPLSAQDVADVVYFAASLPLHVCINDLVITCTQQANGFLFNKSGALE
jgi:3-hydroxy acid dehydrogenase/malonic semialdehyde reductase